MKDIVAIIPVLNEEATIATVIRQLQSHGLEHICVVDNGSGDRTPVLAEEAGATVLHEPQRGYGQACLRGIDSTLATEADWILFCDGDGSDDLSDLPNLLALRSEYDFILGNRRGTEAGRSQLTPVQNFGNWLATRLIRLGWGFRFEDLGPLRLIRRESLEQLAMANQDFGWTVEMQAKAADHHRKSGLRICERSVNYLPRQGGQSKISGTIRGSIKAGRAILGTLASLYWQKTGQAFFHHKFIQRILFVITASLIIIGSILAVPHGDFLNDVEAVPNFWIAMDLMCIGFVLSSALVKVNSYWFWGLAIAPRLIMMAMYPGDDIWRYMWEGHIQNYGFNPYVIPPIAETLSPLRLDWWPEINNAYHAAIYPPLTQVGFRILAALRPSILLFKTAFVAADLGICYLLSNRFGYRATLWYAWNPLVIYSFAGGAHYDSWFLLPLVAAWLQWDFPQANVNHQEKTKRKRRSPSSQQSPSLEKVAGGSQGLQQVSQALQTFRISPRFKSALFIGMSIATKWMSLPVLGFFAWRQLWSTETSNSGEQKSKRMFKNLRLAIALMLLGGLPFLLATLPFCDGLSCPVIPLSSKFVNDFSSASLIPQWIETTWFNEEKISRIYYAVPLMISLLWGMWHYKSVGRFTEHYLITLMMLSPIIHAWYFTWLIPFAVASRNWGTYFISLSALVYFALPYKIVSQIYSWTLEPWQLNLLWWPFLGGLLLSFFLGDKQQIPKA